MKLYGANVEEKLNRANKAGGYDKKFGFESMKPSNMDDNLGGNLGLGEPKTAFDKLLAKDGRKLGRMQAQASKYLASAGSTHAESAATMSKMSSRLSDTSSQRSLPDLKKGSLKKIGAHTLTEKDADDIIKSLGQHSTKNANTRKAMPPKIPSRK